MAWRALYWTFCAAVLAFLLGRAIWGAWRGRDVWREAFILTARQRRSLRQLGDLLGYRPQPAVAAQAEVAAIINKGVMQLTNEQVRRLLPMAIKS